MKCHLDRLVVIMLVSTALSCTRQRPRPNPARADVPSSSNRSATTDAPEVQGVPPHTAGDAVSSSANATAHVSARALADKGATDKPKPAVVRAGTARPSRAPVPVVVVESPTASAGLTPGAVSRVVRRQLGQLRRCLAQGWARGTPKPVRVLLSFSVNAQGAVLDVVIPPNTDGQAARCLVAAARRWTFAPSRVARKVAVTVPTTLSLARPPQRP